MNFTVSQKEGISMDEAVDILDKKRKELSWSSRRLTKELRNKLM